MAPPPHRTHDHHIPLEEEETPPYEPLRPLNEEKMKALKEYLEVNEKWGWIRASTSPSGMPIHFVMKKDGELHLCVNYRQLNEITIKDRTPLPLIGESLEQLSSATIYTKLDIRDAYYEPPNRSRRRMENSLANPVRTIRVLRHAFRVDQCTGVIPTMDERDSERIP